MIDEVIKQDAPAKTSQQRNCDDNKSMVWSILYVAPLVNGSTSLHRYRSLQSLGHSVEAVDTLPPRVHHLEHTLANRVRCKLYRLGFDGFTPRDRAGINRAIIDKIVERPFDIAWFDKALLVERSTIALIKTLQPQCKIVGYSPDDMYARFNHSRQFIEHFNLYDAFFTTKSYGVDELKSLGCEKVFFVPNGYEPTVHKPHRVSSSEKLTLGGPVGFIGAFEKCRARSLRSVAAGGVCVRIWGGWKKRGRFRHPNLRVEERPLWDAEYAKAISAFDINLCFLRKANRDLQTTRSVEIPACGGFMLGERTPEHQALFGEGIEAEFFSSDGELVEKIRHYLAHPLERQRIARAGHARCINSGYSNAARLQQILDSVSALS